jgi:hypothetical protein
VVAGQPARIDFDARLVVVGKGKMLVDNVAKAANFVGMKKRRRTPAPMELHDFSPLAEQGAHLGDFLLEVIEIGLPLVVIQRDDRCAAAIPAKRLAKGDMEIER